MKATILISILTLAGLLHAQEPNPFVKKNEAPPADAPPGPSFVGIVEHILAPPDAVEKLLAEHPPAAGTGKLRDALQPLIDEGTAKIDHIGIGVGTAGRRAIAECILEQIYPTDFHSAGPGVWPYPTAFETRNLGYIDDFHSFPAGDAIRVMAQIEVCEMVGSRAWNALMERTRHPEDVFVPDIRSISSSTIPNPPRWDDPFSGREVVERSLAPEDLPVGRHVLMARIDALPDERSGEPRTRLVFLKNGVAANDGEVSIVPKNFRASLAMVRVPVQRYANWLNQRDPLEAADLSWAFVQELRSAGTVSHLYQSGWAVQAQDRWSYQSVREATYPTEWDPSHVATVMYEWEDVAYQGGKGGTGRFRKSEIEPREGIGGASTPVAFETRNVGVRLDGGISGDRKTMKLNFDWVREVGLSIHRRIEVEGEWIADISFPRFASNRCETSMRPTLGKWMLIHAGSEFTGVNQKYDDHCVLVFLKLE